MFELNGTMPYIFLPDYLIVIFLEVMTVGIEAFLIGVVWHMKKGLFRWYTLFSTVAVANLVTALLGVWMWQNPPQIMVKIETMTNILIMLIIIAFIICFIIAAFFHIDKSKESLKL